VDGSQEGSSYAPSSGLGVHVEVFDAGEGGAQSDVRVEGQDEDPHHPAFEAGRQELEVAGLDVAAEFGDKRLRDSFSVPEPFLEQT